MSDPSVSDHEEVEEKSVEAAPAEASAENSAEAAPESPKETAAEEGAEKAEEKKDASEEAGETKDEPAKKGWASAALSREDRAGSGFLGKRLATQSGKQEVSPIDEEEAAEKDISGADLSLDDKILFYKERECLLLLLEARKLLCSMITRREAVTQRLLDEKRRLEEEERKRSGRLSVQEIQNMLQNSADDDDYDMVSEIQELKKKLVIAVRQNHKLERDLAKLDKRIALLIKNRTSLQDVIAASKGLKSQKKNEERAQMDSKQLEHYQDLFYLLQTEPRYLARCVYMINPQQLENFLETVILTLFGDTSSPREEFLILSLFRLAMEREISVIKNLADFIGGQSETVLPKMINSYNKRKQGLEYLKKTLAPILEKFIKNNVNLEFNPMQVYHAMIGEYEIRTGEPSPLDKNASAEDAAANEDVQKIIEERKSMLEDVCQTFVDGIVKSLDFLPYGLRWLCKQLRELCLKSLPDTTEADITKVTVYFVYYRFINLAIVTPDAYHLISDTDLPGIARKNLVTVSKVLQNLFNFRLFDDAKPGEKQYCVLNPFIKKNQDVVREYVESIYKVDEPEERLQVNKYMELAQKAKPIIIISLNEIYSTHALLAENLDELAPEKDDSLRIVLNDLGEAPKSTEEDNDRELQLTLTNRFKVEMDEEAEHTRLYAETKELVIPILRLVPVQNSIHRLNLMDVLEAGIKYATETNNNTLKTQIKKILENLGRLENAEVVSKDDNYESFVHDVALEVANRTTIREQQRKEVARLKGTLEELHTHQDYVDESIKSYQDYLQDCKEKQYMAMAAKKGKKSKKGKKGAGPGGPGAAGYQIAPVKFSYKDLVKKRVIIDSEVPALSRKKTNFVISSDQPGVFNVVAKIAGVSVDNMELDLDDLLERHYNNITRLELDQVTLDVNMTIHLINKAFLS
mmetsp:Transcript_22707/g.89808  ORF Transcript_22707/g.89808 Transcript_22707/m.89808 type:complete len:920 (-) Transcript_22707:110-2869(-)